MINLKDLQYLKYLNSIRLLLVVFLILFTTYLMFKSPRIETTTKIQLDKVIVDSVVNNDTIKIDTNAHR